MTIRRYWATTVMLAAEQLFRATSYMWRPPDSPMLNVLAGWAPPMLVASSLLILISLSGRHLAGALGHALGMAAALIYCASTLTQSILFGSSWSTLGMVAVLGVCTFGGLKITRER